MTALQSCRLSLLALTVVVVSAAPATAQVLPPGDSPVGQSGGGPRFGPRCPEGERLVVPGAPQQLKSCLADLTTAGTERSGHTNRQDWDGLNAEGTRNPSGIVGIQVDGHFVDNSTTNTNNGFNRDSQFVIRLPDRWNGKLVMSGAPGVRRQYANDFIISDYVLSLGYAFASTDKGNTGVNFFRDGVNRATRSPSGTAGCRSWRSPPRTWSGSATASRRRARTSPASPTAAT